MGKLMDNFARILVCGHLARDVEMKQSQSGVDFGVTSLAVTIISKRGDEKTTWFKVTIFGEVQSMVGFLKKGACVQVAGTVALDTWETSEGEKKSAISIIANHRGIMPVNLKREEGESSRPPNVESVVSEIPF